MVALSHANLINEPDNNDDGTKDISKVNFESPIEPLIMNAAIKETRNIVIPIEHPDIEGAR